MLPAKRLTGCYNRRSLQRSLKAALIIERAALNSGATPRASKFMIAKGFDSFGDSSVIIFPKRLYVARVTSAQLSKSTPYREFSTATPAGDTRMS